jgi:hypothetical protein
MSSSHPATFHAQSTPSKKTSKTYVLSMGKTQAVVFHNKRLGAAV